MFEYFVITALLILLLVTYIKLIKTTKEMYKYLDKSKRYWHAINDLDKWCRHDLPEVEVIVKYLISTGEGYSMNAGTPSWTEACTISGLREQIRRMKNDRQTKSN